MRLILFRCAMWFAGEGIVLAALVFVLAIVAAPVWGPLLPATPVEVP